MRWLSVLLVVLCQSVALAQFAPPVVKAVNLKSTERMILRSLDTALAKVGVKEEWGSNRGYWVNQFLASAGYQPGNAWCCSFVYWAFAKITGERIPVKRTGSSVDMANDAIKRGVADKLNPKRGDIIIWRNGLTTSGHIGRILGANGNQLETIEGNSSDMVKINKRTYKAMGSLNVYCIIQLR